MAISIKSLRLASANSGARAPRLKPGTDVRGFLSAPPRPRHRAEDAPVEVKTPQRRRPWPRYRPEDGPVDAEAPSRRRRGTEQRICSRLGHQPRRPCPRHAPWGLGLATRERERPVEEPVRERRPLQLPLNRPALMAIFIYSHCTKELPLRLLLMAICH